MFESAVSAEEGLHAVLDPSAVSGPRQATMRPESERLIVQRHWEPAHEVPIEVGAGGHGGGDALLLADVFLGPAHDPLSRTADWRDGIRSVAVGIAGNRSLASGRAYSTGELGIPFMTLDTGKADITQLQH